MSSLSAAAQDLWDDKDAVDSEEDSDAEDEDDDPNLRALRDAMPGRRHIKGIDYGFYFNADDFKGTDMQLWWMTRVRDAWDNPPFQQDCTIDDRCRYTHNVMQLIYLTVTEPDIGLRICAKSQRLHWYMPWLDHRVTNTPHAEALYRTSLLLGEALRRSHFICCQPYNSATATTFEEERLRNFRILALANYLQVVILPDWTDLEWDKEVGMDISRVWLSNMTQWLLALCYFMTGTKLMNAARGIHGMECKEEMVPGARPDSGPGLRSGMVSANDVARALIQGASGDGRVLDGIAGLISQTQHSMTGVDDILDASCLAASDVQPPVVQGGASAMAQAACMFMLGAEVLAQQEEVRPVYLTNEERAALDADQCFTSLHHNVKMKLPDALNLDGCKRDWHMRARDEQCQAWSRQPWPTRLMGLWLRCEGDYFMARSVVDGVNRTDLRIMGAMCHIIALQEFGVNVVTTEQVNRSVLSVEYIENGMRASDVIINTGKGSAVMQAAEVNFDFMLDATEVMDKYMRRDHEGKPTQHVKLPWDHLHKCCNQIKDAAQKSVTDKIARLTPSYKPGKPGPRQ